MRFVNLTIYRILEWDTQIELPDEEDDAADAQAIADLASSTMSSDFHSINEEYAELESGKRIDII